MTHPIFSTCAIKAIKYVPVCTSHRSCLYYNFSKNMYRKEIRNAYSPKGICYYSQLMASMNYFLQCLWEKNL